MTAIFVILSFSLQFARYSVILFMSASRDCSGHRGWGKLHNPGQNKQKDNFKKQGEGV